MHAPTLLPPPALKREDAAPLLPLALLSPTAILWLWALPALLLLAVNFQGYTLIEGNLDAAQRTRAHLLGLAGLLNLLTGVGLYVALRHRLSRGPLSALTQAIVTAVPAVVLHAAYLSFCVSSEGTALLPASVANWIYPPERFLYNQFALAMPALFWGMLQLACARPARAGVKTIAVNLAAAVAAPVALFLVFLQARHFTDARESDAGPIIVAAFAVLLGVAMFTGLIRVLALGFRKLGGGHPFAERVAILIFAVAMPIAGLALNRSIPFPNDFQAWEVYAMTAANAATLLLASWQHTRRPLLSFGLLCATLPFTLYFFVVFLPFLPLSILAVIALGAGFLVLTPTVLLMLHLSLLNKSWRRTRHPRLLVGALCFLLLPGFFTVRGLADKAALNAALDHLYAPAIESGSIVFPASRTNLQRALANHRSYKDGIYYPLLSDFYAWLVFDHLVLPDDKLARLETAFFGHHASAATHQTSARSRGGFWGGSGRGDVRDRHRMPRSAPPPRTVVIENLTVRRTSANAGATVVTLAHTLQNTGSPDAEFIQLLPLPAGVFVNGFRLHIDGHPVPGRITEKKTALWVYTMIRDSERRDPGLLFYNAPDELELRVFPVIAGKPSVVEIDFLVPAALADTTGVAPGESADTRLDPTHPFRQINALLRPTLANLGALGVFACGLDATALPAANREPYLHVIVDRSADNGFEGDLPAALANLCAKFPAARTVRVTLANYETLALPPDSPALDALPKRGGFLPDLALAQALRQHRDADLDAPSSSSPPPQPVVVFLRDHATPEDLGLDFAQAWTDLLPSLEIHTADAQGQITTIASASLAHAPLLRLGNSTRPLVPGRPLRFKPAPADAPLEYWSALDTAWKPVTGVAAADPAGPWPDAVALQLHQQDHTRSPGDAPMDLGSLVRASRETGVMVAATSYIVVENAAQWRMLELSERQKLAQNAALAFKEAPAPTWLWLAGGWTGWLTLRRFWPKRPRPFPA